MTLISKLYFCFLSASLALCAAVTQADAQEFPSKPIHFIVPFGAGTTTDQAARFIGQRVAQITKQPIIVENKPGANGFIAMQHVLAQPADGYTIVMGTNTTHAANVSMYKKLPYDPVNDFEPITGVTIGGVVLAITASMPAKNVQELIALAKKNPGKMTFGSANSSSRAGGEVMRELAGIDIVNVPYRTLPAAITDLMGGQIDMVFGDTPAIMPNVRAGRLRALGVSTKARMPGYENIPTIAEQGVPGYEVTGWLAVFAPKGTPAAVIAKLNGLIVPIMKSEEAEKFFGQNAWKPIPGTPDELGAFQRLEVDRWARLVKAANIEPE
jgi:tripartite-type tricarboxylate transporter receptor subunit TctC